MDAQSGARGGVGTDRVDSGPVLLPAPSLDCDLQASPLAELVCFQLASQAACRSGQQAPYQECAKPSASLATAALAH